jgi:hypothetical protein
LWLFVRPALAWKFALVIFGAMLVCVVCKTELVVRSTGTTLEVLGLFVAGRGLAKTRREFDKPPLQTLAKSWWGARPWMLPNIHHATAGALVGGPSSVSGFGETAVSADASLEQRLTALEENLERLRRDFGERERNQAALSKLMLARQSEAHATLATELNTKLERAMADGLLVSMVGLVWVFLGSILSTMSSEISCLLLTHHLPASSGCTLAQLMLVSPAS